MASDNGERRIIGRLYIGSEVRDVREGDEGWAIMPMGQLALRALVRYTESGVTAWPIDPIEELKLPWRGTVDSAQYKQFAPDHFSGSAIVLETYACTVGFDPADLEDVWISDATYVPLKGA